MAIYGDNGGPITVVKRNGSREEYQFAKISKEISRACEGVSHVSESEIELALRLRLFDGITTSQINETVIKAVDDMITEKTPEYALVEGRLILSGLRKDVYGSFRPWPISKIIERGIKLGLYDNVALSAYSDDEMGMVDAIIRWDSEQEMNVQQAQTWTRKYLVRNRATSQTIETPAAAVALQAMALYADEPVGQRMALIKTYIDYYDYCNWPSPHQYGLRTTTKQGASCTLLTMGDDTDEITNGNTAIVKYTAKRAGMGINFNRMRGLKQPIRNGETLHTGPIGFIKAIEGLMDPWAQGGLRKGSGTVNYALIHPDVESLLVLKNEKGEDSARARFMDYCMHINCYLVGRLLNNEPISLFSPEAFPDLYDAFYSPTQEGQDLFIKLYEMYESSLVVSARAKVEPEQLLGVAFPNEVPPSMRGQVINSAKQVNGGNLRDLAVNERKDTGRIYFLWADHVNLHSSFMIPVEMTNLCVEITLPNKPIKNLYDDSGRVALCNLAAINWGQIEKPEDFEIPCKLVVETVDKMLDYQDYFLEAARLSTEEFRPLGIGIVNLAYFFAKRGLTYGSPECLEVVHEYAEAWSYYLIKASVDLAERKGPCKNWKQTKYGHGILPIDTYKRTVDELAKPVYQFDWETLRARMLKFGIRNATLMALMPAETSAGASGSTNGIEPVRALVIDKQSEGSIKQVVPGLRKHKKHYTLAWEMEDNVGYLSVVAVLQKFIDQAISANVYYNPKHYKDSLIPTSRLVYENLVFPSRYGIKTLYYSNTLDDSGGDGSEDEDDFGSEAGSVVQEECESCKL